MIRQLELMAFCDLTGNIRNVRLSVSLAQLVPFIAIMFSKIFFFLNLKGPLLIDSKGISNLQNLFWGVQCLNPFLPCQSFDAVIPLVQFLFMSHCLSFNPKDWSITHNSITQINSVTKIQSLPIKITHWGYVWLSTNLNISSALREKTSNDPHFGCIIPTLYTLILPCYLIEKKKRLHFSPTPDTEEYHFV